MQEIQVLKMFKMLKMYFETVFNLNSHDYNLNSSDTFILLPSDFAAIDRNLKMSYCILNR